jgi:hypothetical protein
MDPVYNLLVCISLFFVGPALFQILKFWKEGIATKVNHGALKGY